MSTKTNQHGGDAINQIDSRIARLIEEYEIGPSYGEQLERCWTAERDARESLRALAERVNQRLLESAMAEAGMSTLDKEITSLYRLLTDRGVGSGNRVEAKERLRQAGINGEQLGNRFVTPRRQR